MDDQNAGGNPPKRPEMNEAGAAAKDAAENSTRKKRRNRRRRKPSAKVRPPVQAESETKSSSLASDPQSAPANGQREAHTHGKPALPSRHRQSGRGRRRGGKGKKRSLESVATTPQTEASDGANSHIAKSGETKTKLSNTRSRNRATKRPGRERPKENGASPALSLESERENRKRRGRSGQHQESSQGQRNGFGKHAKVKGKSRDGSGAVRGKGSSGPDRTSKKDNLKVAHRSDAYAALDLGTNNCRLLVAVPQQPGRFRVVDAFSRIVRLGEGLAASGRLSDAAMDRAVGALKACADKLEGRSVRGVRLIATEACRRASNGADFLKRVEREAGLKLEIIDRETEAHLAVAGCSSLVDRRASGVVLFDIGGGSSELALLDLSKRRRHDLAPAVVSWTSLPLGVVTLSEKHGGGRKVTRPVFEGMVAEVAALLENFEGRDSLEAAAQRGEIHLLGTSGTVTTLAGIHLKLPRYDRRMVDGTWMRSSDVTDMIDQLVDMTFEERVANPCIGRDRADLVLAGCAILVAIQQLWPCPRLRVADRGLREGLLTQMMNRDNAWQKRQPYRR